MNKSKYDACRWLIQRLLGTPMKDLKRKELLFLFMATITEEFKKRGGD